MKFRGRIKMSFNKAGIVILAIFLILAFSATASYANGDCGNGIVEAGGTV